jgi:hypothetical protein
LRDRDALEEFLSRPDQKARNQTSPPAYSHDGESRAVESSPCAACEKLLATNSGAIDTRAA